jgi:hypothetical protein
MMKTYSTPEAFKQALESRIRRKAAASGSDMGRFRQVLVFDRFLARVHDQFRDRVVVKGGVVLELRLQQARATKDIDLRLSGDAEGVLDELREAGRLDLDDWLTFEIVPDPDHPTMQGEGMVYDGYRFRAEARLAGRLYASPFGIDVGFADVMTEEPELVPGSTFLEFIGVEPPQLRIYPRTTHIAEKLHAYTLPRERVNTRVKDLPDLALLALVGSLSSTDLRRAIDATFEFRNTHPVPTALPDPPPEWAAPYERMARHNRLPWATLDDVKTAAAVFLNPVLEEEGPAADWFPETSTWTTAQPRSKK